MVGMRAAGMAQAAQRRAQLRCLAGRPLSPELRADAAHLERWTPSAVHDVWRALEPCLFAATSPRLDGMLTAFCADHGVAKEDLRHVARVACHLLRSAASVGLAKEAFRADLAVVWPHQDEAHAAFLEGYEAAVGRLRGQLLENALATHGNVLSSIDWRIDRVMADNASPHLALPIAMVTLGYRHRGAVEHLTLQLTPEQLHQTASMFLALAEQTERLKPQVEVAPEPNVAEPSDEAR